MRLQFQMDVANSVPKSIYWTTNYGFLFSENKKSIPPLFFLFQESYSYELYEEKILYIYIYIKSDNSNSNIN